jgi:anti-sigma factor RsiW
MSDERTGSHQVWDELVAAHALHALEPTDELRLIAHVDSCPSCRKRLDEFTLVAAQLGSLADDVTHAPSWAQMRPRLTGPPSRTARLAPVLPLRRRTGARVLAATAAAVVVIGGATAGWQLTRPSHATPTPVALSACQQQRGCQIIQMHGRGGDNAAVVVEGGQASLVPIRLPAPAADRMYVLWQLPRDGSPIPVVTLRDATHQTSSVPLVTGYADTAAFAVSVEAAGPMPTRPTDVLAVGAAGS